MKWIKRNPKFSIPAALVVLGGVAWLAFGFFGVHLLFVDDKIAEAPPVFAATEKRATTTNGSATTPSSSPASGSCDSKSSRLTTDRTSTSISSTAQRAE